MPIKKDRCNLSLAIVAAFSCLTLRLGADEVNPMPAHASLDRARREVRMLDDIYKGGIVTITQHYVNDVQAIPAGTAFKKLFQSAEKNGWHQVRLLDATGEPLNEENVAKDDFERKAIKALIAGKKWVETTELRSGTKHLRVATPIPVVLEKCTLCHDHYLDVEPGKAIGALAYTVPIDGPLTLHKDSSESTAASN